jgi:hypothetical protein
MEPVVEATESIEDLFARYTGYIAVTTPLDAYDSDQERGTPGRESA